MSHLTSDFSFVATASRTVGNTGSELTAIPTGVGTLTLTAGYLQAGTMVRLKGGGVFSTLITPGNLTVKVKLGSTTIASVVISNLLASASNNAFDFEATITCRTTGASGTVITTGLISYDTGVLVRGMAALNNSGSTATVDTTADQIIDVTVQWATSNAANTLTTVVATVEVDDVV